MAVTTDHCRLLTVRAGVGRLVIVTISYLGILLRGGIIEPKLKLANCKNMITEEIIEVHRSKKVFYKF